ncbi:isoprenylcysteine carboxylmethyltransferase family protein [Candidatus Dojkabacteria bacterium]|nr:isoprenylcysteine carboxylmethyltransferase family protein [Candidatus Dojkabacteria bacterium]
MAKSEKKTTQEPQKSSAPKAHRIISNPDLITTVGFILQFVISILSHYFEIWVVPYAEYSWYIGIAFIVVGFIVSFLYQRAHEKSDLEIMNTIRADEVEKLIIVGIYGKIRHPGYLGTILMQFGMAFSSQSYLPFISAVLLLALWVIVARSEEKFLLERFPKEYKEYMEEVRWKFVPFIY